MKTVRRVILVENSSKVQASSTQFDNVIVSSATFMTPLGPRSAFFAKLSYMNPKKDVLGFCLN